MSFEFDDLVEEMEIVKVKDEDGVEHSFYVIDGIKHNDISYLLVSEDGFADDNNNEDDEICEAVILKEISVNDSSEVTFEVVEEDAEFDEISKLFSGTDGDYEIEI